MATDIAEAAKNIIHTGSSPVLTTKYIRMKDWIEKYFSETWEEVKTDIDFSKYEPISTGGSLHVHEERYEIEGEKYRLLCAIGYDSEPIIEILKKRSVING